MRDAIGFNPIAVPTPLQPKRPPRRKQPGIRPSGPLETINPQKEVPDG